tara:strand:+ start:304 stop:1530 length:1227 start_codon:yes stop_codon:yes gene_type:complete
MGFDKTKIAEKLTRKTATSKKALKKGIQDIFANILKGIKPAGGVTGTDKINQLILEQASKLQTLATDQITEITQEFGIIDINTDDPKIELIPPSTEDLKLPEIPEELNTATPKLTLTSVKVPIKELDIIPKLIQGQFEDQLLPIDIESLQADAKEQVLQKVEVEALALVQEMLSQNKPSFCPADDKLQKILKIYNLILKTAEDTATILNYTSASLNILTGVINGAITVIKALSSTKTLANQAAKAIPLLPGVVVSVINDIDDLIDRTKFEPNGSPRLVKIEGQLTTGAYYISIASGIVNALVTLLKLIKPLLDRCGLQPDEFGEELNRFILESQIKEESSTNTSYQGFTFEIVKVSLPNDPTVKRTIAQALNTEGVVALQTEPSFTQNPKVLIEELKLLIDKDNLKAY